MKMKMKRMMTMKNMKCDYFCFQTFENGVALKGQQFPGSSKLH